MLNNQHVLQNNRGCGLVDLFVFGFNQQMLRKNTGLETLRLARTGGSESNAGRTLACAPQYGSRKKKKTALKGKFNEQVC